MPFPTRLNNPACQSLRHSCHWPARFPGKYRDWQSAAPRFPGSNQAVNGNRKAAAGLVSILEVYCFTFVDADIGGESLDGWIPAPENIPEVALGVPASAFSVTIGF